RAWPQEGFAGTLAWQGHAGPNLVRPLLHRAQSRPPRAGRHARGSRVGPIRRDVLGVSAAQRVGKPALGVGAGGAADAPTRQEPLPLWECSAEPWAGFPGV